MHFKSDEELTTNLNSHDLKSKQTNSDNLLFLSSSQNSKLKLTKKFPSTDKLSIASAGQNSDAYTAHFDSFRRKSVASNESSSFENKADKKFKSRLHIILQITIGFIYLTNI